MGTSRGLLLRIYVLVIDKQKALGISLCRRGSYTFALR
jgi:hypothetical protein